MGSLNQELLSLDGASYGAYRRIQGVHPQDEFTLLIDRVQADPFASPSRVRVQLPMQRAQVPSELWRSEIRCLALCDFLTRRFGVAARQLAVRRGSGGSGRVEILEPSQAVLARSAVLVNKDRIEVRFRVGLPAVGRRIAGREAAELFGSDLPEMVKALYYENLDGEALRRHVEAVEDGEALRSQLASRGLVGFVGNGAILARESGVSDRPLKDALPFQSPPSLAVTLQTPNAGPVEGMGIPEGLVLIVGGGFHGKSTLLRSLMVGVYNHGFGDGRERVVLVADGVKIRAEDGRSVRGVDLSPFINNLPGGQSTQEFSTNNASGSTSQAANLLESMEAGASVVLMDEDSCATNFLVRDGRMQALIAREPITPLVDRVRSLYADRGVSTLLVMGGCGDYLDGADCVIGLEEYQVMDWTERARAVVAQGPSGRQAGGPMPEPRGDRRLAWRFESDRGGPPKVKVRDEGLLLIGREAVDLAAVEQLVEAGQLRMLAAALVDLADGRWRSVAEILAWLEKSDLLGGGAGDLVAVRPVEVMAAINRLRSLM
jgi:predicted ABC-class ATPase